MNARRSDLLIAAAGLAATVAFAIAAIAGNGEPKDALAGVVLAALGCSRRFPRLTWAFVAL